eukprot:3344660-Prymnesium_polylepis.1
MAWLQRAGVAPVGGVAVMTCGFCATRLAVTEVEPCAFRARAALLSQESAPGSSRARRAGGGGLA